MQERKAEPALEHMVEGNRGLCGGCVHARIIASDRGSTFLQCGLSFTDPCFEKYPRLPVLVCSGYTKKE